MNKSTYFNIEYEKKNILYIEHDGYNVITITNILWLCKEY